MGCQLSKVISSSSTNNSSCAEQFKDAADDTHVHNGLKSDELEPAPTLDTQQITLVLNTWELLVDNVSKVGVITFMRYSLTFNFPKL